MAPLTPALVREPPTPAEWGDARPGALATLMIGASRHTVLGRGALRRLLATGLAAVHASPVDLRLWGCKVRLHPWNNVSERKALLRPDRMDPLELAFVANIVSAGPSVFLDIGANAGLYSLRAVLAAAPGSLIVAVEPDRELLGRFLFNLRLARECGAVSRDVSVTTRAVAISDRAGEGVLSRGSAEGGGQLTSDGPGARVEVITLAGLLRELGVDHVDLLKLDVEGHEDRVLPPFFAASAARLWPRAIIVEHLARQSWSVDCIAGCIERGYEVRGRSRTNTILQRPVAAR